MSVICHIWKQKADLLESHAVSPLEGDSRPDDGVYCLFRKLHFDPGEVACILHLFHFLFRFGIKFGVEFGRVLMVCPSVEVLLSVIMNTFQ